MSDAYRHGGIGSPERPPQWSQCSEMILENGFCFVGFIWASLVLGRTQTEVLSLLLKPGGGEGLMLRRTGHVELTADGAAGLKVTPR